MKIELENIIKELANALEIYVSDIKINSRLREDLGMDSLDAYELIYKAECKFDIHIEDEVAKTIDTVQDALNVINERIEDKYPVFKSKNLDSLEEVKNAPPKNRRNNMDIEEATIFLNKIIDYHHTQCSSFEDEYKELRDFINQQQETNRELEMKLQKVEDAIQKESDNCHKTLDSFGQKAINRLWHKTSWAFAK